MPFVKLQQIRLGKQFLDLDNFVNLPHSWQEEISSIKIEKHWLESLFALLRNENVWRYECESIVDKRPEVEISFDAFHQCCFQGLNSFRIILESESLMFVMYERFPEPYRKADFLPTRDLMMVMMHVSIYNFIFLLQIPHRLCQNFTCHSFLETT